MTVYISREALTLIGAEASAAALRECCGILIGYDDRIMLAVPAANVALDASRHFEIDPQALIDAHRAARAGGPQVLGYYHSHPSGPAHPSPTDQAEAARDGLVWAIAGAGGITFWRDDETGFAPLSYAIIDR